MFINSKTLNSLVLFKVGRICAYIEKFVVISVFYTVIKLPY